MLKQLTLLIILSVFLFSCQTTVENKPADNTDTTQEPLSLWNNSEVKTAIVEFVEKVTDENSADFVPVKERIAVFDNDGTLWNEKPLYIPVEIELAYIKKVFPERPEWKDDRIYSAIAEDNLAVLKDLGTAELATKLFAAHKGQKEEDYKTFVYETLSTVKHRKYNRPLKEVTYSPMVELVGYLQANCFNVYIVTGGEITSVRTVSEEIYNIPKENVVGTSVNCKYISNDSGIYIEREAEISSNNDKQVKPVNIELHIGRKPIFAAGNSDGDYQMMEYTLSGRGPSMAILVHHDDEVREYTYMHGTENAIKDAAEKGWFVVSMKNDFKEIFAE
ncbi:HAD family hydrolase [uncultured Draconibacterium sp.]|uniref:HAD family hydrolase n=1 Tax=uncultured Draconibacterium sp. TaxID=1573823 RepID=UPI00321652C1